MRFALRKAVSAASIVLVLGLLLGACIPAAVPTPSGTATPTPSRAAPTPTSEVPATSNPRPAVLTPTVARATPTSTPPGGEKPRYGGVLRLHLRQAPPDYDAQVTKTYAVQYPTAAAYDKLVVADFKDETKVYPQLAERWELSPDGTAYIFHLRQGVKFHDGTPFTAADVVATLKRWAWPPRGVSAPRAALFLNVKSVEAADDYTVKVTLKAPQASFLPGLGIGFAHIYSKSLIADPSVRVKKMLGTGPFKFKREVKGVSVELVRNPDYWDKGLPYLDGIIHYIISDDLAIEGALRTKRVDMLLPTIHELKGASLRKVLKDLPDLKWDEHPVTSHRWLWPQNEKAPWNDVRVRRALLLAIDKLEVIEIAQQGAGIVGGYLQPGSGWEFPVDELVKRPGYHAPTANDIAEARRLLKEANFPFEREWPIIVRADVKYMRNAAEVLVAHLKKVGIRTKLDPEEAGSFYNRGYAGDFDLMMMGNTMEMSDPDIVIGQSYLSSLAANYGKYSNPRVDELFSQQQVTLDLAERRRLVREIEDILFRDITRVSIWWDMDQTLWWPWVRGYTAPNNRYANREYRTVWLAERR